jgi:hypothetical protein
VLTVPALLTFYVQTWDEYHTHTLTLGIVSGPVEGILTLCIVYALTAYLGGGSFWQKSMLETIGVSNRAWIPEAFYQLAWNEWYLVYGGIMLVFNTFWRYVSIHITTLLTACFADGAPAPKTSKKPAEHVASAREKHSSASSLTSQPGHSSRYTSC